MSISLDKLRALRRQAGATDAAPPAAPPVAAPPLAAQPSPPAGATAVTTPTPARTTRPASALDWINHTIRHADPAALAERAHGRPASLRPATVEATAAAPPHATHPTPPVGMPPVAGHPPAPPLPPAIGAPARPPQPPSALDWINHTIRHADPAALAARAHGRPASLRPATLETPLATHPQATQPTLPAGTPPLASLPPAAPSPAEQATRVTNPRPARVSAIRAGAPLDTSTPASASVSLRTPTARAGVQAGLARAAAAPASLPQPSPAVITPRSVGDLQRLLAIRQRAQATAPVIARQEVFRRDLPGEQIAPGLWLDTTHVPMPVPAAPLSLAFARRPEDAVDPHRLLFFDTETTGLAGGTGTRAFMIGAADFHDDPQQGPGLRVRQLLIASPGAEAAMLDAFTGWLGTDTLLSSFNGRSYDAPLLKTRYRLARRHEPLGALEHIDLLHPARRRWKGLWENCRLATIELQVLGITRDDDLPGSQAPAAWLDFLRGGSSARLHRVAAHNHQDVVTLALLFQRLVKEQQAGQAADTPTG